MSVDKYLAFSKIKHTHYRTDGGGFTGSVMADEAVYITAFHGEGYVVRGFFAFAVDFCVVLYLEDFFLFHDCSFI